MNRSDRFEASRSDEGRYRLLVDAISDYAIYMLDPNGIVSSWNPGAQRFKGYVADEIIGQHFSVFYTEEERRNGVPALALSTAATEGRFEREGWRVRKDGTRFWAHVVIDPIRTPDGALIGYAKITRDLTERHAAERALRESEQQFQLLVEGVTDYAIYMLDPDGFITNWNAGAERIKGHTREEVVGTHFSRFYTEEEQARGTPALGLATAASEGRWEQEGWRVRKDGRQFWAHVIIDAIRNTTGELIGFAKITRDITERMETQRDLDQAREALFQSQKLEAIGQLTGGVAHDFNNLLAAILGSLDLVKKRLPDDPRITPLLDNALQGAQRGATLTQRMLAFARKQELSLQPTALPALVVGMIGFLERTLGPTVEIQTDFPDRLPLVQTDPSQLENALLNLAVNARDAMPDGGVITISAEPRSASLEDGLPAGDYVRFVVADTGEGMDEDTLGRAREPFFTTKGVGKGTGLGLSMVHGLSLQSGGKLEITSHVGEGTAVELWLPVAEATAVPHVAHPAPAHVPGRSLVVLAVDDDALVLMNTAALLEDLGHRVISAASGMAALKILEDHPDIDLVVTDQAMPQMTGTQLRDAILEIGLAVPVIIASGYAEIPSGRGAALRLSKPFTQDELARVLDAALEAVAA